jgi:hypothetical protein
MKKIIFLSITALAYLFTACDYNELNFEGLDEKTVATDVKTLSYTLTDADYAAIGTNSTNKAIAKEKGDSAQLANLKTTKYFTEDFPASTYVPAFIASKWFTADNKSTIKVTYNKNIGRSAYLEDYQELVRVFSTDDYKSVNANVGLAKTFYPSYPADTYVPTVLKQAYPTAVSGDICLAYYNTTNSEPVVGQATLYEETFNSAPYSFQAINVTGSQVWTNATYGSDTYMKISGYSGGNKDNEDWLVSSQIDLTGQQNVVAKVRHAAKYVNTLWDQLTLNVSTDFNGTDVASATWTTLTINTKPTGTDYVFVESEDIDLSAFTGKKIYLAFKYLSTTTNAATWEVDNIKVLAKGLTATGVEEKGTYYKYSGSKWETVSSTYALGSADYLAMGITGKTFSSSAVPENYLPQFLLMKYPYAQADNKMVVGYKYYSSTTTSTTYIADEYLFGAGVWTKASTMTAPTDQFVKASSKWVWDPSVVIELLPVRNNATSMLYYQAATDWVWENIDQAQLGVTTKGKGYVTTYGNNEYYTGCSAYYNNVDMRPSTARAQYPTEYGTLSDAEVTALMTERLKVVMKKVLTKLHHDVVPIEGVNITYTVKVAIYTGSTVSAVTHSLVYKVVGPGEFEYVSGPTPL